VSSPKHIEDVYEEYKESESPMIKWETIDDRI